jgi:hypothetical protein
MKKEFKPLTTKDVALGIGRKFTTAELNEYLNRTKGSKGQSAEEVKKYIASRLSERKK